MLVSAVGFVAAKTMSLAKVSSVALRSWQPVHNAHLMLIQMYLICTGCTHIKQNIQAGSAFSPDD